MTPLRVDIWSDLVCPFCYIGRQRLLAMAAQADIQLDIHWHSFELAPDAPATFGMSNGERLAKKYNQSPAQTAAFMRRIHQLATEEGIADDIEQAQSGNTFNVHRLLKLAKQQGNESVVMEAFFKAYLCDALAIGTDEILMQVAQQVGMSESDVQLILHSDAFSDEVRADETQAQQLGINSVPHFIFGQQSVLSGVPDRQVFLQALQQATQASGEQCGVDCDLV